MKILWVLLMVMGVAEVALAGAGHEHGHASVDAASGRPGKAAQTTRTVRISTLDSMRYDQSRMQVRAGETVRFIVHNPGKLPHEFALGSLEEQQEHAVMMAAHPDMQHHEANTLSLAPGETRELVWQFGKAGKLEIACHLPGHYEAGMKAEVIVGK